MIKVKTNEELKDLDDSLNLFTEDNWDFFGVSESEPNYEYFNDIRDNSFDKDVTKSDRSKTILLCCMILCLFISLGLVGVNYLGLLKKDDYKSLYMNKDNVKSSMCIDYVKGESASNDDTRSIINVLNGYFGVLNSESSYEQLYTYCKMTSSFTDIYNSFTSKITSSYDINDCYARSLREFGSFCSLDSIDRVIYKDGIYYCYANITIPSKDTIYEYVYENKYNFSKHFNSTNITEQEVIKYMIETLDTFAVPKSPQTLCIKFSKDFKIIDDSIITSSCIDSYTECVNQIIQVAGNTLIK